ncbi:hypothetical protein BCR42DRAFT_407718 [Absidia repens]|uniref:E3 ubiquitin-protein ligase n=1 Tax=Absidia repens TaxID=90262 RepID=A0A1X2ISS1_9FUNG|nr:hypothetical protein BCR42DRAFT_407718 [Absidia repens]
MTSPNVDKQTVCLTLMAVDGLLKSNLFVKLPDPFAVVTVDREQIRTTTVMKRTPNPYWNESFELQVTSESVINIQVFDQRQFKRGNQGFLGSTKFQLKKVIDMQAGGDETLVLQLAEPHTDNHAHGKLLLNISVPTKTPTQIGSNSSSISEPTNTNRPTMQQSTSIATSSPLEPSSLTPSSLWPPSSSREASTSTNNFEIESEAHLSNSSSGSLNYQSLSQYKNESDGLPFGWEKRVDHSNRTYFVDHNTRTTTWTRPSNVTQSEPLKFNALDSRPRSTHEIVQERPTADESSTASNAAQTAIQTPLEILRALEESQSTQSTRLSSVSEVTDCSTTESQNSSMTVNENPLPAGWEIRTSPEGRTYFANRNTLMTAWTDPRRQPHTSTDTEWTQLQPVSSIGSLPSGWERRLTSTGRAYYVDHHTKITTWNDPRLRSGLRQIDPQYKLDFSRKLTYFRSRSALQPASGHCHIKVRRDHIFPDSFDVIMRQTPANLKKRLVVKFHGEEGLDYGGLSREYFFLLSHEIFNPIYCLFEYSAHDNYTLQISPHSNINPEHLNYFKFIGRIVGLAIFHRRYLDAYFIVSFYKMILVKKVSVADLESVDNEFHRSLLWILNNDITDVLELTFSVDDNHFGEIRTLDLVPFGRDIEVTEENKKEYVALVTEWRISKRVEEQFEAFKEGFNQLIPQELINVFDERELELLIGGIAEIDVDDWEKYTVYRGYTEQDETIRWFWKCVRSWDNEKKSRLLQFTTGTSRIPINGFKDLHGSDGPRQFTIEKSSDLDGGLPKAHTCFNRIDMPIYRTYDVFVAKLSLAVEESLNYFGQD